MCLCVCVSVYLCVCVSVCLSTFILSMRKSVGPNENAVLQNGQFQCTLKTRQLRRYERQQIQKRTPTGSPIYTDNLSDA